MIILKKLFVVTILLVMLTSCATMEPISKNDLIVVKVVEKVYSKEKLFSLTNEWLARTFVSSKDVIDYKNEEEGKIICKGYLPINYTGLGNAYLRLILTIDVKDNKVRMVYECLYNEVNGMKSEIVNKFQVGKINEKINELMESFNNYINKSDDNW